MSKVTTSQSNFSSGEISKLAFGRYDITKYANSAKTLENFIINQLGGVTLVPGKRYVAGCKSDSTKARLMPFQYGSAQDYVMEMGNLYTRFFNNDATTVTITSWDDDIKFLSHFNGADASTDIIDEIGGIATVVGAAEIDTAQQKFGTGSLYLAGSNDNIVILDNDDGSFGTGDFTVDAWVRLSEISTEAFIGYKEGSSGFTMYFSNSTTFIVNPSTGAAKTFTVSAMSVDTWYHIAIVRNGNNLMVFLDGTKQGANQDCTGLIFNNTNGITVGYLRAGSDIHYKGWIDELRIVKGTAEWIADFTAPTTPYAKTSSTELSTPYLEADLLTVMQAHKNDVKYLVHEDYAPRKISRTDATSFAIAEVDFVRGPFLDDNITAVTLNPSAATGTGITITASASTFEATHVDSLWKIKSGVVKITAVASATSATGDVQAEPDGTAGNLGTTAAGTDWAEGAFSGKRGYPSAVAFHDGALFYGGTTYEPQKIWKSVDYAYDNFDEDDASDDDASTFEIATEERIAIKWLMSGKASLEIGTGGGTFSASGDGGGKITPTSIQITRNTNYGVASLPPKRISSFIYYIQRTLFKLRELSYNYDIDSKIANDMNLLAEHILKEGDGVIDLDHQQSPNDRIWCVRDDGQMSVLTRNPEQEVMGWSRLIPGTDSTGDGVYESVCVIPKTDADDQIWVIVKRVINGTTKRFIEYFTVEDFDEDWDAVKVDCSVTMDNPKTITAATKADPVVVTSATHGFSNGDQVKINGVVGMTELNGNDYLVANKTDDTFEITDTSGNDIDGTAYTTYISGGEVRLMTTAISGLSHLEGESVRVQADGVADTASYTVASGAITLSSKAAVVHTGLWKNATIELLKFFDGSATGTGRSKKRRIYLNTIMVYRSLGMKIGLSEADLETVYFGDTNDEVVTDLFTGDLTKFYKTWWDSESEIMIRQDKPSPLTILSVITRSEVLEK